MKIFLYAWYSFRSVILRGLCNSLKLLRAEVRYEKEFGIKTAAIKKSDSSEFFHYQGAGYLVLLKLFRELPSEIKEFRFVDIGCGKGRAVFVAEYCGFSRLTGIELDKELVNAAAKNLGSYHLKRPGSSVEFIHVNALEYSYRDVPAVYFLFNPFNEKVLNNVLDKILRSTRAETWFIYMNPLYHKVFEQKKIKEVREFKTRWYSEAIVYKEEEKK